MALKYRPNSSTPLYNNYTKDYKRLFHFSTINKEIPPLRVLTPLELFKIKILRRQFKTFQDFKSRNS